MAERKRTLKRTSFTGKRKVVRRRKKSRGHSLLLLLFFLVVISVVSCTVAHPFSDEKETMVSVNTARSLLKEMEKEKSAAEWKR